MSNTVIPDTEPDEDLKQMSVMLMVRCLTLASQDFEGISPADVVAMAWLLLLTCY